MSVVARTRLWLRALFSRRSVEGEMAREIAAHMEMERQDLERRGLNADDAARQARRAFGNVDRFTEEVRDERGTRWLDNLAQDVRYALRQAARTPLSTAAIIAMLAIGIGANSMLFALVEAFTVRPPAGIQADPALARIRGLNARGVTPQTRTIPYVEFAEYRARGDVFASLAGWMSHDALIDPGAIGDPQSGYVQFVTSGFFNLLQIAPQAGSILPADGDSISAAIPAVVSHRFWRSRLGGTDSVIGKTIKVGNTIAVITGVAPPRFNGAEAPSAMSAIAWLRLSAVPAVTGTHGVGRYGLKQTQMQVVGRLRSGVSFDKATLAVSAIASGPNVSTDGRARFAEVVPLRADNQVGAVSRDTQMMIGALGALTFLILAIICTNVSALVVGRGATRRREIGVRLSLGATRARLVRQLMTESAVLAVSGGALGLALLAAAARFVNTRIPDIQISFGFWTLAGTAVLALGTSVLFGLSPALYATRTSVGESLKNAGATTTRSIRIQRRLIVAQIALSQPLLVGVALLLGTALQEERIRVSSSARDNVAVLILGGYGRDKRQEERMVAEVREATLALSALPTVAGVTYGAAWNRPDELPVDGSSDGVDVRMRPVGPGFLRILGLPISSGRDFSDTDIRDGTGAVIVRQELARRLWGEKEPVGQTITGRERKVYTVIGVTAARQTGRGLVEGNVDMYVAFDERRDASQGPIVYLRTNGPALPRLAEFQGIMRRTAPNAPVARAATVAQLDAEKRTANIRTGALASGGGVVALLLAAMGLYAVISFAVTQQSREIGVRMALGATRNQVVGRYFFDGVRMALIGSVIGVPASVIAVNELMTGASGVRIGAWGVGIAVAISVISVAAFATWFPARRAATVDPVAALRTD